MANEIRLPDIGDFKNVPIIEVLMKPGQSVAKDEILLVLESDKATLEVPAPEAGTIGEVKVKVGDKISQGDLLATFSGAAAPSVAPPAASAPAAAAAPPVAKAAPDAGAKADVECDVLVLGAGPGGYTAAFRAADLGAKVALVDKRATLGGVCLNIGCIPSKALLHAAKVADEAASFASHGLTFAAPKVDLDALRGWKDSVVKKLTGGLIALSKQRKVTVLTGEGKFASANTLKVKTAEGEKLVRFKHAIIAAGSEPVAPGFIPKDPRIWDSTGALDIKFVPKRMLVLGGGIIGLEMATVYAALGTKISVIEMLDQLMPGADKDIVAPFAKRVEKRYELIRLQTKVTAVEAKPDGIHVSFEGPRRRRQGRVRRDAGRGRPQAERRDRRRGCGRRAGRCARLHRRRQADAHQCAEHLRHRRRRRPADAGA